VALQFATSANGVSEPAEQSPTSAERSDILSGVVRRQEALPASASRLGPRDGSETQVVPFQLDGPNTWY
jgi:hypothetical protein